MPYAVFVVALLALVLAGIGWWVLTDARTQVERGRPVTAVLLGLTIDQPETWAMLCLIGSVFFVPMYLVARRVVG